MESELVATTREDDGSEDAMADLLCPICWELLHRPHRLNPCLHLFCDPCLRRLAVARIHKCPICRSPIKDCHLDQELHDSIEDQYQDVYIQRQQAEMNSGIASNAPYPDPGPRPAQHRASPHSSSSLDPVGNFQYYDNI